MANRRRPQIKISADFQPTAATIPADALRVNRPIPLTIVPRQIKRIPVLHIQQGMPPPFTIPLDTTVFKINIVD